MIDIMFIVYGAASFVMVIGSVYLLVWYIKRGGNYEKTERLHKKSK